jgi:uncharacterized integral membrane protein
MRIIVGALWLVLFLVLFAFAVNNTALTDLHFFAGMATKAPLIALLLAFFIAGFAFGFIALMPAWVRQRVEIRRLRRLATRPVDGGPITAPRPGAAAVNLTSTDVIQHVARGARATN